MSFFSSFPKTFSLLSSLLSPLYLHTSSPTLSLPHSPPPPLMLTQAFTSLRLSLPDSHSLTLSLFLTLILILTSSSSLASLFLPSFRFRVSYSQPRPFSFASPLHHPLSHSYPLHLPPLPPISPLLHPPPSLFPPFRPGCLLPQRHPLLLQPPPPLAAPAYIASVASRCPRLGRVLRKSRR